MSEYVAMPHKRIPEVEKATSIFHSMIYTFPKWRVGDRGEVYVALPGYPDECDVPLGGVVVAVDVKYDNSRTLTVTVDAPVERSS